MQQKDEESRQAVAKQVILSSEAQSEIPLADILTSDEQELSSEDLSSDSDHQSPPKPLLDTNL